MRLHCDSKAVFVDLHCVTHYFRYGKREFNDLCSVSYITDLVNIINYDHWHEQGYVSNLCTY